MDSKQHKRILGYARYQLAVTSKMEYHRMLKNGERKTRILSVNFNDEGDVGDHMERKCREWLHQVLKRVKCTSLLDLRNALIRLSNLSKFRALQFAKLQPHMKKIVLPYSTEFTLKFVKMYDLLLRYSKHVKAFHWIRSQNQMWSWNFRRSEGKQFPYEKFINLTKKNRLTSLEFSPENSGSWQDNAITSFPRTFKNLKSLTLNITPYIYNVAQGNFTISLSKLDNLKKLTLVLSAPSNVWGEILNSIPAFSKIEYLHLKSANTQRDQELFTSAEWLDNLPNLQALKIDGELLAQKSSNLLKRLQNVPLKRFYLNALSFNKNVSLDPLQISECFDHLTELESLTLKIRADFSVQPGLQFIEALPNQISKMSKLKKLTLVLHQIFPPDGRKKKPPFINLKMSGILSSLKSIQRVTLYSNHLETQFFSNIFEECCSLGPQLLKLKLATGKFGPSKAYAAQMGQHLAKLEKLKVLKLPDLSIVSNVFFQHLVDTLTTLKSLRKIQFGELEKPVTNIAFFPAFEKLLQGLFLEECKIKIDTQAKFKSKESKEQFEDIVRNASKANYNRKNFVSVARYYYYSRFPNEWTL